MAVPRITAVLMKSGIKSQVNNFYYQLSISTILSIITVVEPGRFYVYSRVVFQFLATVVDSYQSGHLFTL